jgi:hypothetical protein
LWNKATLEERERGENFFLLVPQCTMLIFSFFSVAMALTPRTTRERIVCTLAEIEVSSRVENYAFSRFNKSTIRESTLRKINQNFHFSFGKLLFFFIMEKKLKLKIKIFQIAKHKSTESKKNLYFRNSHIA